MKGTDLQFEEARWVWEDRIPTGALTYIAGPSGAGKSTLAARLAADLTTGKLNGTPEPVAMMMIEDSDARTTGPRFAESGGDLSLLQLPKRKLWKFPRDLDWLRGFMDASGTRVAIIDPLTSAVPSISTQTGREILDELHHAAEEDDIAIIFLHHFIKAAASCKTVKEAVAGGHHVYNIARSIFIFGWDPSGATDRFVLTHEKLSDGPKQPSLAYERRLVARPTNPHKTLSTLEYIGEEDYTPLEVAHATEPRSTGGIAEAKAAILNRLATDGEVDGVDLETSAVEEGHAEATFRRARSALHKEGAIESVREGSNATLWRKQERFA
jgi:hypothetical protein